MVSHLEDAALIGLQLEPNNTSLTFSSPIARDLTDTTTDDDLLASLDGENIISQIREKINDLRESSTSAEPLLLEAEFDRANQRKLQVQVFF